MMFTRLTTVLLISALLIPVFCNGQSQKALAKRYLTTIPSGKPENIPGNYRMTAIYTNRDLYGNFMNKTKVWGDYTRGLKDGYVSWKNVYIANSSSLSGPFPNGIKQEYMENMKYIPSSKMLQENAFRNFPASPENIFARNLIWDMMSFEIFAWNYNDSLRLNKQYLIPDITGQFDMAEIGKYFHNKITLCWKGISEVNGVLCAVIDFNAIDNILEMSMEQIKTKGTEQYWGTVFLSLKTMNIEKSEMYGGSMQEIEVNGLKNKILVKTIRELFVERIQ